MNRSDLDNYGEVLPDGKTVANIATATAKKGSAKNKNVVGSPASTTVFNEYGEITNETTLDLPTVDAKTINRWSLIGILVTFFFFLLGLVFWIVGLANIKPPPDPAVLVQATATANSRITAEAQYALTVGVQSNATATAQADFQRLDIIYAKAVNDRAAQRVSDALAGFQELDKLQKRLNLEKYPDVSKALFDIYIELGTDAWQSPQAGDFDKGFASYKEAEKLLLVIAAIDQDSKKEEFLKTQLSNGNYYFMGVTAYNQKLWASAVSSFMQVYKSNPKLRQDLPQLYYDSLYNRADELKNSDLDQAYQLAWAANNLPEITDKRRSASLLTILESKYKDQGKAMPTPKA